MELMVIYKRSGVAQYELPYETPLRDVTSAKLQRQHMANDYVQLSVHTTDTMTLEVGDWIEVRGCRYSIRSVNDITRSGEDDFTYNITFYGKMYDLIRYKYRNTEVNGRSAQQTFDLTLSLKDFIKVIINNVCRGEGISEENAAQSPFLFDEATCPDTDPKTMSFDKLNCLTALQNICKEFDVEFLITQELNETYGIWQSTIHIGEFGSVVNNTPFAYGEGNGLYQLQETKVDDSCIVNRLWVEGSTENILSGYRGYSMRLQLPRKNVPLIDAPSGTTKRYTRHQHTIEIDGEKIIFKEGFPIGINNDAERYADESNLYAGSNDLVHGMWKKEGGEWHYAPFNPSGLIAKYGILEESEVFDDIKPSPTFRVLKLWSTNGTNPPNSRQTFFCDVPFDLGAIWTDTYADFREWCLLKTQLVPSEAQYTACKTVYDDSGSQTPTIYIEEHELWTEYRREIGDGTIIRHIDPYVLWRQQHHSAAAPELPTLPADYDQDIYAEYDTFRTYLLSADNSKYLIDGGSAAFIDGKCAGIDFPIASFVFQSKLNEAQRAEIQFSSSKSYAVGDICLRTVGGQRKAYEFTTTHQGSWNSSHVTEIHLGLLTINTKEETDTGDIFPSEDEFGAFRLATGDQFKLVSIYFPYTYYEDAEEELWFAAFEKFEIVKFPNMRYKLTFDQLFVGENKPLFEDILPGDYISITDSRFGLSNKKMRVTQVDCNLLNDTEYSITLESVRKQRTRTGMLPINRYEEVMEVLRAVDLDDPRYRKNNRTSGSRALSHLTANGLFRADRVADEFIAERMIANLAITTDKLNSLAITAEKIAAGAVESGKIADLAITTAKLAATAVTEAKLAAGAVTSAKLASNAVTAEKIAAGAVELGKLANAVQTYVRMVPALQQFVNAGDIFDRHFEGTAATIDNANLFKVPSTMKIVDSLSKVRLGYNVNVWNSTTDSVIDFENGDFDGSKAYDIYAKLESDGKCAYKAVVSGTEVAGATLKIGVVSKKDNQGHRTYTSEIGQTYMENGVLKNAGTTILDLKNGIIRGALKFSGLKDSSNNDIDIVSLLGSLPSTSGGLRKILSDAVGTIGDEITAGTLLYRAATLESHVGEDDQDVGGLLYRAAQLESGRSIHMGKINEVLSSLESIQTTFDLFKSRFNTLRTKLIDNSTIQSSDVAEIGTIGSCQWNPLQREYQCTTTDVTTIPIPARLQN